MSDIWIDKYRPKNIKEIIGNTTNIDKINKWIKDDNKNMSLVISGYHGIGKNLIVRKILEKNNYNYKWLDYKDEKGKSLFEDLVNCFTGENLILMNANKEKFVLVINDVDKITLKNAGIPTIKAIFVIRLVITKYVIPNKMPNNSFWL